LNSRLSQPSPVMAMSPQQPQQQPPPQTMVRQMPPSPMEVGQHMTMVTDSTGRLQMMQQHQQSPPNHMMGSPLAPPGHMYSRPVTPTPPAPVQAYMTSSMSPQRRPLDAMGQMTHPQMAPTVVSPHSMGAPRFGPRMGMPQPIRPPMPNVPRIQFYGHDPTTKRKLRCS
jgi:hypothetical protein